MQIDIKEIKEGNMDGEYVWVCDYRQPDLNKKPIRNVPPQKVLVVSSDEVNGKVYYSNSAFLKLNKKGKPTKSVIKPYDNTGYRSYTGVELNVFDNEQECVSKWNEQLQNVSEQLKHKQSIAVLELQDQIDALANMLK